MTDPLFLFCVECLSSVYFAVIVIYLCTFIKYQYLITYVLYGALLGALQRNGHTARGSLGHVYFFCKQEVEFHIIWIVLSIIRFKIALFNSSQSLP